MVNLLSFVVISLGSMKGLYPHTKSNLRLYKDPTSNKSSIEWIHEKNSINLIKVEIAYIFSK